MRRYSQSEQKYTEKPTEKIVENPKPVVKKPAPSYLTPNALKVYEFLGAEPVHVDEITSACNLSTDKILSAITELEIYGLVTQISGRRYKIN
jgi:DNA processing protein